MAINHVLFDFGFVFWFFRVVFFYSAKKSKVISQREQEKLKVKLILDSTRGTLKLRLSSRRGKTFACRILFFSRSLALLKHRGHLPKITES